MKKFMNKIIFLLISFLTLIFAACMLWDIDELREKAWINGGNCAVCWKKPCICDMPGNVCPGCGEWTLTINPTCTTEGEETKTCAINEAHNEWRVIAALGHNWGEWTAKISPTEITDGVEEGVCGNDSSHIENRVLFATGTIGLEFELINDNTEYSVRGGAVTGGEVYIPSFYCHNADSDYLPVTRIGSINDTWESGAFTSRDITAIQFLAPSNLSCIGAFAFVDCFNLTEITLPAGITSIGDWAFFGCVNLIEITLPAGVTSIGDGAFSQCKNLTEITLPAGITSIGDGAFSQCENLTEITLPAGLTSIGNSAFSYCTSLTEITLPLGLTSIDDWTFFHCTNLTEIILPSGLTSIGERAFQSCTSLTEITLPAGLSSIGNFAFSGCSNLIFIINGTSNLSIIDGGKGLVRNNTEILAYPSASGVVTLPAELSSIGCAAFYGCIGLTEITLPTGLSSIGAIAFYECESLTIVTFMGIIPSNNFSPDGSFPGDLRVKYLADGIGTYTRPSDSETWTKE